MEFNAKEAAQKLLKIADIIEKQAQDLSYFICDKCNHTANLTTINTRRKEAAAKHNIKNVSLVDVNTQLSCPVPGCDGTMKYAATEESEKFYEDVDAPPPSDEEDTPDLDEEGKPKPKLDAEGNPIEETPPEADNPFEPVDEQDKKDDELDLDFGKDETPISPEKPSTPTDLASPGLPEGPAAPEQSPEAPMTDKKPSLPPPPPPPPAPEKKPLDLAGPDTSKPGSPGPSMEGPDMPPPEEKPEDIDFEAPKPEGEEAPEETPEEKPLDEEPSEDLPSGEAPSEDMPDTGEEMPPSRRKVPKFEKMPEDEKEASAIDFQMAVQRYSQFE